MSRLLLSLLFLLPACASKPKSTTAVPTAPSSIEEAVANPDRKRENVARDKYRHPVETLHFFGLTPNMNVIEINPGGGWYTEILQPLLAKNGHYSSASDFSKDIAPPGSADMIVTFRNVHNWMKKGNTQEAFNAFFKALKKGGTLGLVEHRADPKSKHDPKAESGYVHEQDAIGFAEKAGFKLVAKSEINANPKDLKNYPKGVWTLPPTMALEDKDHEIYYAIGESDRMTLKFVKP